MSYIQQSATFAPINEIQELNFEEIDGVGGGVFPIIVAYYAIGIASTVLLAGAGFVASARVGYAVNRD